MLYHYYSTTLPILFSSRYKKKTLGTASIKTDLSNTQEGLNAGCAFEPL